MRRHFVAALFNANLFETILSQSNAIVDNTLLEPDYDNLNQIQFHRQSTGQAFTTETVPVNPGIIEHNSNGEFIKFLKALVTTIIAIILSHLWYIDQRDDDFRQRRFLNHNFYDFTRSDSGFYSKRSLQNPGSDIGNTSGTRQKYRPHKSRHSSKSGRSSKYNKRSLANRQTNLECITESEDEAIAELNYLNENSSPAANSVVSSTTSLNGASFPSSDEENENYKPETKPLDQKTEIEKTEAKDLSAEGELVNVYDLKNYSKNKIENHDNEEYFSNSFNFSPSHSISAEKEVGVAFDLQVDLLPPASVSGSSSDMSRHFSRSEVSNENKADSHLLDCDKPVIDYSLTVLTGYNERLDSVTNHTNHNLVEIDKELTLNPVIQEVSGPERTNENQNGENYNILIFEPKNSKNEAKSNLFEPHTETSNEQPAEFHSKQNNTNRDVIEEDSSEKNGEQEQSPMVEDETQKCFTHNSELTVKKSTLNHQLVDFETSLELSNDVTNNQLTNELKFETKLEAEIETEIETQSYFNDLITSDDYPQTFPFDTVNFHTEIFENVLSELESDDFRELISMLATGENEIAENEEQNFEIIESSDLKFQKQTETNSELASQEQPKMSPSTNSTPTNTLTSPENTHGGYPAPYHQKSQNLVPQTLMDSGRIHLSRSPRFYDVKRKSRDPKFNPAHMNGNQHYSPPESARSSDPRSYKKKPEVLAEEKKIVIANELTETDKRRTSIAEAYPYIKDGSNSSELVIGITRNESFLKHKQVTDKVLTDIQELQQEFEENQKMFLSHRFSFDSEEKAGTSFSFDGHLNASCLSSNDRIVFEGLSKEDIKTHKDISIRRKTQESMSSDDNYSVSTREMLDDITDVVVMIRCRYKPCGKIKELKIARTCYKMCHNCFTYYCSKSCRENHWERHKIKCVYSRVNSTCKNILNSIRHSQSTIATLSDYAESQYDINGRGGVLLKFSSHPDADNFVRNHDHMPDFEYITGSKLEDPELCQLYFAEIGPHLSQIITSYDPLAKFLVIIAVDLSAYKESNQKVIPRITSRFMCKYLAFRIFKDPNPVKPGDINLGAPKERTKALVATSIVKQNSFNTQKDRKLFFSNLQRNLKNKGVNIRVDFPFVYQQLCNYVETGEHFEPITLYPHDPATGQQFMCLIMPDSQPNFLSWVSEQT